MAKNGMACRTMAVSPNDLETLLYSVKLKTAMMKRILCGAILLLAMVCCVNAQDQLFTQFYHSPLYLNPAFTGCGKSDFRASFTSRLQWMNLPSPLRSHTLAIDKYFQ